LKKKGPIYQIEWSPDSEFFCAVYGFMPAKATLYDNKGNIKFDYGTGPRNTCHFNPQGTKMYFYRQRIFLTGSQSLRRQKYANF